MLDKRDVSSGAGEVGLGHLLVMVTACGWGLNWTVLKFVLHDWPPLFARGTAGLLGAAGLAVLARLSGQSLSIPKGARASLAVAAAVNVFAWMGFTALSLNWLKVSEGALIAYSMPIWAMLIAWPLLGQRPGARSLLALALGIAGIVVLLGGPDFDAGKTPGVIFGLAAAILFALGTVRGSHPVPLPFIALTAWQVALGCLPMVVLGLLLERPRILALSPTGALGLAYMAVGPMAICYLTWFGALKRLPTSVAATAMLLVPIVGTVSAAPLLGDPLGAREAVAVALTLGGVGLALRTRAAR